MCYGLPNPGYVNEGWYWKVTHFCFTNKCLDLFVVKGILFDLVFRISNQPLKVVLGLKLCCDPNVCFMCGGRG